MIVKFNREKLWKDFKRLADGDNLSHAYFFFGESQIEKFDFAAELANYLKYNVDKRGYEPGRRGRILEECLVVEPDEKGGIGIDTVKKINGFLYQKPVLSKKRIAIIKNADNMTVEAQNAVLKIVEEPPGDVLIIFIAKNEDSLLSPLASRLQKIYFSNAKQIVKADSRLLKSNLEEIVENDKIDEYFESLIAELRENPIKNAARLRETFKRLAAIKMFNTNKKLQLKCL